jgi:hypothetical protein
MPTSELNRPSNPGRALSQSRAARLIAFYLPQFHPIPENDQWWGKGFTEWTNVAKARPLFRGHYQPHVPADLGFYDLRVPEVRAAQAALARAAGIEGFCYWHYWFEGRRILERPFNEVLRSGDPDFPFCLGWANHSWTGIWHGAPNKTLIQQTYPGRADYERHFHAVLVAFHDPRYIRVRGKPVFVICNPRALPQPLDLTDFWQELALKHGLPGIHFVANVGYNEQPYPHASNGFAAAIAYDSLGVNFVNAWQRARRWYQARDGQSGLLPPVLSHSRVVWRAIRLKGKKQIRPWLALPPNVIDYKEAMLYFLDHATAEVDCYPCVFPNWDNSPRAGLRGTILHQSTPELFRRPLRQALRLVADRPFEDRLVFVKSWNEWAEGNYLEPDLRFGHQYLEVVREEVTESWSGGPAGTHGRRAGVS